MGGHPPLFNSDIPLGLRLGLGYLEEKHRNQGNKETDAKKKHGKIFRKLGGGGVKDESRVIITFGCSRGARLSNYIQLHSFWSSQTWQQFANTKTLSSWLEAEFPQRNLTMKVHTHVQSPGIKHVCWVFFVTDFVVSCCINVLFNVFCICISAGEFVDLIWFVLFCFDLICLFVWLIDWLFDLFVCVFDCLLVGWLVAWLVVLIYSMFCSLLSVS